MKPCVKKQFKEKIFSVVLMMVFCAIACMPAVQAVSAATSEIVIPYTHIYDAEKNRTKDVFTYRITAIDGAPMPEGSVNGHYDFRITGVPGSEPQTGEIKVSIPFGSAGEYKYKVSAYAAKKISGFVYDDSIYTLHVYVKNGSAAPLVTASGSNGRKVERLTFNPGHKAEVITPEKTRPTTTPDGNGTVPAGGINTDGTPAAVQAEETAEEPTPLEEMIDNVVPKADPERQTWALVNLLEAIATVVIALVMLWRFFERIDKEEDEYVIRRGGNLRLIGIIPAVVAVATFIGTEDMRNEMAMIDEMTAFMTGCLVVSMVFAALAYMKYSGHDGENTELSY